MDWKALLKEMLENRIIVAIGSAILGFVSALFLEVLKRRGIFGRLFESRTKLRITAFNLLLQFENDIDKLIWDIRMAIWEAIRLKEEGKLDERTTERTKSLKELLTAEPRVSDLNDNLAQFQLICEAQGHFNDYASFMSSLVLTRMQQIKQKTDEINTTLTDNMLMIGTEFCDAAREFYENRIKRLYSYVFLGGPNCDEELSLFRENYRTTKALEKFIPRSYRSAKRAT